ncbi:MAG: hypothetical protein PVF73_11730, partial [Bacteroidales bacterium]
MNNSKININDSIGSLKRMIPEDWGDISSFLKNIQLNIFGTKSLVSKSKVNIAYLTFEFGVDGVTREIMKYARRMELLLKNSNRKVSTILVGERFYGQIDKIMPVYWKKKTIKDINGWDKWQYGRLFSRMFHQKMPKNSAISQSTTLEVWNQSIEIAFELFKVVETYNINLFFLANVSSNPGNVSLNIALIIISKLYGLYVINSNHDFFWNTDQSGYSIVKQ